MIKQGASSKLCEHSIFNRYKETLLVSNLQMSWKLQRSALSLTDFATVAW